MMNDKKHCNKVNEAAEAAKGAPKFKGGKGNTLPLTAFAIVLDGVERDKGGLDEAITAESVAEMGEHIALKALKTCYQASGGAPFVDFLFRSLVGDLNGAKHDFATPFSIAYDIADEAINFLCGYIGKKLSDPIDGETLDKKGNPVSILRACFRAVNRYIYGEKKRDFKRVYVENLETGAYIPVPYGWSIDDAESLKTIKKIIKDMKLSVQEYKFLKYRLRGYSLDKIAEVMGKKRGTVNVYRQRVIAKAERIGLSPSV